MLTAAANEEGCNFAECALRQRRGNNGHDHQIRCMKNLLAQFGESRRTIKNDAVVVFGETL